MFGFWPAVATLIAYPFVLYAIGWHTEREQAKRERR